MTEREKYMKILRNVAAVCFGISFLMALNLFGELGRSFLSKENARIIFIGFGGVAMVLNLLTFQSDKFHPIYNLTYWLGSIGVFLGLVFMLMQWPFGQFIVIGGMLVIGTSFFLPKKFTDKKEKDPNLLDD